MKKSFHDRLGGCLGLTPAQAADVEAGLVAAVKASIEGTQKTKQVEEEVKKGTKAFLATVKRRAKSRDHI